MHILILIPKIATFFIAYLLKFFLSLLIILVLEGVFQWLQLPFGRVKGAVLSSPTKLRQKKEEKQSL